MILIDFVAMIMLYVAHRAIKSNGNSDNLGDFFFVILGAFGCLFLFLDLIDKIKGLF